MAHVFVDFLYYLFLLISLGVLFLLLLKALRENPELRMNAARLQGIGSTQYQDRQGNIFTISEEVTSNQTDVYGERIRTQLEKDDKDLPSYEEVMRMSLADFPSPPLTHVPATPNTDTILMVPPSYTEVDPYASPPASNSSTQGPTGSDTAPAAPSTSRAAAAAATANPSGAVAIALTISPSNTSV